MTIALDTPHKKKAAVATALFLLMLLFFFFFMGYYEPNPPVFERPPVEMEVQIDLSGGSAGGSSSSSDASSQSAQPSPQPQPTANTTPPTEVDTQTESPVTVPSGEQETNSDEATNSNETQLNENAMAGSGTFGGNNNNGNNNGNNTGPFSGGGSGSVVGDGTGASMNGRSVVNDLPNERVDFCKTGVVVMKITADQTGKVQSAQFHPSESTLSDANVIQYCKRRLLNELKFNQDFGAEVIQQGYYKFEFKCN